ncbi:4-hydroxy-3-methylbut-2-enyl diphosphate reductase [Bradyrhizobium sp. 930_D9_N1_4]|uniref:4-hydroxy-3-methylbut-2-enyl diphosphate reductase n=1 Tax=Bradyrhizobium sp. 930_D9_N1_4 TaxID=3240374 RepID=UPI003F8A73FE
MEVYPAQPRGFGAGVVRAIEIVERALETYGPSADVRHQITKVHNQGKRTITKGRTLILIGHAGHPEVNGAMGQVPAPVLLVQSVEEANALPLPADTPVAYITQTTLSVDDTKDIISALQARFTDIQGPDIRDICYATQNRQSAVRDLSKLVDVILVVGAANSSNSNRLREIGTEAGVASYLIADGSKLNPAWLKDAKTVGVTAGASAPEVLVDDVIEAMRRIGPVKVPVLPGREENIEFRLPAQLAAS